MKNIFLLILSTLLVTTGFSQNRKFHNLTGDTLRSTVVEGTSLSGTTLTVDQIVSEDSSAFVRTAESIDTTAFKSVDDTLTGGVSGVTTPMAAITSNNTYAVFPATGSVDKFASYTFPAFSSRGEITGVNLSIEYKMAYDTGSYYVYFKSGEDSVYLGLLPIKLTTDTTVVFGTGLTLNGLDVLRDSVISAGGLAVGSTIVQLVEDTNFAVRIRAEDSTLSVDHIQARFRYTIPKNLSPKETILTVFDYIKIRPQAYPPVDPEKGMIYMDTDNHIYVYSGTTWVKLDNLPAD